jgi:hypothetical protein
MPYTPQPERKKFEPALSELRKIIKKQISQGKMTKGDLTYLVYTLGIEFFKEKASYTTISTAISCLNDAAEELRRSHLNPYEDKKIKENGDVK